MTTSESKLRLQSHTDLLSMIPYMLGFQPADSIVILAVSGSRVVFASRVDTPSIGETPAEFLASIDLLASHVAEHGNSAIVIGYGERDRVTPAMNSALDAMQTRTVPINQALRLSGDRIHCHLCPDCLPADGMRFDPDTSTVQATAVSMGMVAMADRDSVAQQIAPVGGSERQQMQLATHRALARLQAAVARPDGHGHLPPAPPSDEAAAVARLGVAAVDEALVLAAAAQRLDDDQAAWLSVLLMNTAVRDYAWKRTNPGDSHTRLWTDVLRRAMPDLAAPPAVLLAYSAMLNGTSFIVNFALERALHADPEYSMARLLLHALHSGVPLHEIRDALRDNDGEADTAEQATN
jgi:hypothetical protein